LHYESYLKILIKSEGEMKRHKYDEYDLWLLEIGEKTIRFREAVEELARFSGMTNESLIEMAEKISKLCNCHISESIRFLYAVKEVLQNE
jgi:hypothetical protein